MPDHPGKLRRIMAGIASRVAALRKARKKSQAQFAEEIGVTQPTVSRWERGIDEPEDLHIDRMAALAGVSPAQFRYGTDALNGELTIPAVGYIVPGETVQFVEGLEPVPLPPELEAEGLRALIIKGNALRPLKDGWRVYYRADHDGVPPAAVNDLCVVETEDGKVYVKTLRLGAVAGTFTLDSWSGKEDPIENVHVRRASIVLDLKHP